MNDEKILCKTPTRNKKLAKIDKWKYDAIKKAILITVPHLGDGEGVIFKELSAKVADLLTEDEKERLGSINWFTTCVKLDMELKGELKRYKKDNIQRLYLP